MLWLTTCVSSWIFPIMIHFVLNYPGSNMIWANKIIVNVGDNLIEAIITLTSPAADVGASITRDRQLDG